MSREYFFYKYNHIILVNVINILIIIFSLTSFSMAETIHDNVAVRDYIENKFDSAIFHLYLGSMEDLDSKEIEFIDLLVDQPRDSQIIYSKKVYQEGFKLSLLEQLKEEIEEREKLAIEKLEEAIVDVPELHLPTLPSMKFWERMYARMISMQKMITTTEYNRFSYCGVDPARSERVVKRVKNYFDWCSEWTKEGRELEELAEKAESEGNIFLARQLYHSAAGCFHIGNYLNYYDVEEKIEAQNLARECYEKAIALYDDKEKPIRIDIPFQGVEVPGYLMLSDQPNKPLIIFVNVLNNIKEVENHFFAQDFIKAGFNIFNFDGPGQGEMHQKMPLIPDYEKSIHAIIDWFEMNNEFDIDLERIGVLGISFGGFFSIKAAATDSRIDCVIGNGGFAYFPSLSHLKKINIFMERSIYYMTGYKNMKEIYKNFGHLDIKESQPLDRPMLIIQGGKDKIVPTKHAYYYMEWAKGDEKELLYIEDANHCCQDYFDIIVPYMLDWLKRYLL
jgi:alpha-beta hydrolase superfamily lysophospholipase